MWDVSAIVAPLCSAVLFLTFVSLCVLYAYRSAHEAFDD